MALTSTLNPRAVEPPQTADRADKNACGRFVVEAAGTFFGDAGWPALHELGSGAAALPFQCRDHLAIWQDTIGKASRTRPYIATIRDRAGRLLLLLPLGVCRRGPVRVLGFLDGGVADYNAPVLFPGAETIAAGEMHLLWRAICARAPAFDVWALEKCAPSVSGMRNPLCAIADQPWPQSGHALRLSPDTLARSGFAADSRRQRKRLAEIGQVTFEIVTSETDTVFNAFLRQKSRRYRETLGHDGFDVPGQRDYYRSLLRELSPAGTVQLSCLRVGNEIVATHWGLIGGKRFYYMMPAYEGGGWRRYSPGRLLMEDLMAWSLKNGLEYFDFGIGDEDYKRRWQAEEIPLYGACGARTLRGRLFLAGRAMRRRIRNGLPESSIAAIKTVLRR